MTTFQKRPSHYRLTTAEITYHLPDHPHILQSFVWQNLDLAPTFPALRRFLAFWQRNLEGKVHSVKVACSEVITSPRFRRVDTVLTVH